MTIKKSTKSFIGLTNSRLSIDSQLQLFNIYEDVKTKEKFLNIFKAYSLKDNIDSSILYELYTVENDDWWENIAYKYYGEVDVWWTIPLINNVINPFEYLEEGKEIFVLKQVYLNKLLDEVYLIGRK